MFSSLLGLFNFARPLRLSSAIIGFEEPIFSSHVMFAEGVTTAGISSTLGLPDIATSTAGGITSFDAKVVLAVSFFLESSSSTSKNELITGASHSSYSSSSLSESVSEE